MKRLALLIFPLILVFVLIACDGGSGITTSNGGQADTSKDVSIPSGSTNDNSDTSGTASSTVSVPDSSNGTQNETEQKTFTDIPVTLIGTDALDKAGFKPDSSFNKTVSVTVKGTSAALNAISASDITATIDVSAIIEAGDIECMVEYKLPDGIEFVETSDYFVTIKISKKSSSSNPPEITPPSNPDAYMSNGIIVSGNRGMEAFGGSESAGQKTANKLNEFKQAVGASVNVYALPCPTASAFYAPDKYPNSINAHVNFFNGIRNNLVDVKFVDTLSALSGHTDEYIYYRTDFHWTGLAGYYAAEALAEVAGTPFDDLSTYTEKCVKDCFSGALVRYASVLGNDPDDVYWYEPSREYTVTYYSSSGMKNPKTGMTLFSSAKGYTKFMHGDAYTAHIQSNVGNGRKLLIFKNSYGNALAPYVLSSFDEVYIADIRKFQENAVEFINEYGITDVCFAMSSHAMAGSTRDYITKLLNY